MPALTIPPPIHGAFDHYTPPPNYGVDLLSTASSSKQGVRSISIALSRPRASPSTNTLLETLLSSIAPLLAGQTPTHSLHHLSATCHRLVLPPHGVGREIYARVKDELHKSVQRLARDWRGSIIAREKGWLGRFVGGWKVWEGRVELLSAVFVYLDKVYCDAENPPIRDAAIAIFREGIWENELLFQKTRDGVLDWAARERAAEAPEITLRPTISALSALAQLLAVWDTLTEPYLASMMNHYDSASAERVRSATSAEAPRAMGYVRWFFARVEEERERAQVCLTPGVAMHAVASLRAEVGGKAAQDVVKPALAEAMDTADATALEQLYSFAVDVDAFPLFAKTLQSYIETRLTKLISDPANDSHMIEETLELKRFTDRSVAGLFTPAAGLAVKCENRRRDKGKGKAVDEDGSDEEVEDDEMEVDEEEPSLEQTKQGATANIAEQLDGPERKRLYDLRDAVRAGFKAGIGSRQNAPAEWIAKHLDTVMRKGQGSGTEGEFSAVLDEIIDLVGYTPDKDVFRAFYSAQLAKRLLLARSASDDLERTMIVKLQREMGEEFTSGDIMMKDLQLSETLVKSYQSHLSESLSPDPTSLSAHVLTESAWPAYPLLKPADGWDFKLPPGLQGAVDRFAWWYATQHKNRMLSWRWQLGTVTLSARLGGGVSKGDEGVNDQEDKDKDKGAGARSKEQKYEIGVSLFQAVVLMLFNEEDVLGFEEIKARTGIETAELGRTLQSLSLGRRGTRVLSRSTKAATSTPGTTKSKDILPSDRFALNRGFTSPRLKFKINQIQADLSEQERAATNEQVAVDRVSVLEATIVRIMKGKKKSSVQGLIDEVVRDVGRRWPPDVKEIKRRVESLIEREFLERAEGDRNMLHYLA